MSNRNFLYCDPDALRFPFRIRHEVGVLHSDVRLVRIEELEVKAAEDCCDGYVEFSHCQTATMN